MTIGYTARNICNSSTGESWTKYMEWSNLTHLTDLISLDVNLCPETFQADVDAIDSWDNLVELNSGFFASVYKTIDYVISKTNDQKKFNLLAVIHEPIEECENLILDSFEFIGYDLLDKDHTTSALTNCGGFEETFKNSELNKHGLIDKFSRAKEIQENLIENNEEEYHADTDVWAVWRHLKIGR